MAPHIILGPQLGRNRQRGLRICTFRLGFSLVYVSPSVFVAALLLASLRLRSSLCLSAQVGQRVWPGMAGSVQLLHRPVSLAICRFCCASSRCFFLRSGLWFLFRSYSLRATSLFSSEVAVSSGVLLGGRVFGSFSATFLVGAFSFLRSGGLRFFLFFSLRSMVYWKTCPSVWLTPVSAGRTCGMKPSGATAAVDPRVCGADFRS